MIEYVDVGMMGFLKAQFPDHLCVWAAPEAARQMLSNAAIKKQQEAPTAPPSDTVGIPGLAIFRTNCVEEVEATTLTQINAGWPVARWADTHPTTPKWFNFTKAVRVLAEYTVVAIAEHRSDMNTLERKLWFMRDYKTVDTVIQNHQISWPVQRRESPVPEWETVKDTGKVLWYKATQKLVVPSIWAESKDVPPIEQILVKFQNIVEGGDPIDLEDLAPIVVIPE